MDIQKIRKILGKEALGYSDEELLNTENETGAIVDLVIDMVLAMTPEQRKELNKKIKNDNHKAKTKID